MEKRRSLAERVEQDVPPIAAKQHIEEKEKESDRVPEPVNIGECIQHRAHANAVDQPS